MQTPDSDNVYLRCTVHDYWGKQSEPVVSGCKACWSVYYFVKLAKGNLREGEDEVLEALLHYVAEEIEKTGGLDFKMFDHPRVSIERDGKPDIILTDSSK